MLREGDVVAGRYRLLSLLGEGAMGAVWRAEDQTLKRQIAIKFLFVQGARDPQAMVDQFLREARIAASVQHRNVIHTVDFGTVDATQPFMVMELLDGESLGERMEREPRLSREQFVHLISLTLRGLAAVHDAGIVHRDLKPQNIFLQRDADAVYPKILDFGISRSLQSDAGRASAIATQQGLIIGTPDYMSPEQARGEADIDRRSDVYSMGAILYEGLTGRLPFVADTIGELIVQIVTKEAPHARQVQPDVPAPLSDLVAQAMSRSRDHRFADARAMRRALSAAMQASNVQESAPVVSLAPSRAPKPAAEVSRPPPVPAKPQPVHKPKSPSPASGGARSATWGDFEGLEPAGLKDAAPLGPRAAPSVAPAKQQRLVARSNDPAMSQLASAPSVPPPSSKKAADRISPPGKAPAVGAPSAASSRKSKSRGRPVSGSVSEADKLDALYDGSDAFVPEIDYERMRAGAPKRPRVRSAVGVRSAADAPKRGGAMVLVRPSLGPFILPIIALLLVAYVVFEPTFAEIDPGAAASDLAAKTADEALLRESAGGKARRERPGEQPPHMRDVAF